MAKPVETDNETQELMPTEAEGPMAADGGGAQTERAADDSAPAAAMDPAALLRERDDYYDRLLRKTAEFDNYRKRVERERREQSEYAAADVLTELLPLVDDLERALGADTQSTEAYRKGVELIHKQMLDLLRRRDVKPIQAVGEKFDPHVHQAVAHEHVPGHEEGDVVEEFRRGYRMRDRLLRPAMVKVAKA